VDDSGRVSCSQWGAGFELRAESDDSWTPLRGAYEFRLRTDGPDSLSLEIGEGRLARLRRLDTTAVLPAGLPGAYHCKDAATTWQISGDHSLLAEGFLLKTQQAWTLQALTPDLVELRSRGYWMQPTQLLRLRRDTAGRITALVVDTGRIKGLVFERLEPRQAGA